MKLSLFALDRYLALFPGEIRRETSEGDDGHGQFFWPAVPFGLQLVL